MDREPVGWNSRGYLPHYDAGAVTQFITFRLADSVPASLIEQWMLELGCLQEEQRRAVTRRRIERYLDKGCGSAWMRDAQVANIVERALLHFDGKQYTMHEWVVMPNHVHALFTPGEHETLRIIVGAWKSVSCRLANRILRRKGQFWQEDYFDRYIRDADHYARARRYIRNNPVNAGLCRTPEEWKFGSARRSAGAGSAAALGRTVS